MCTKWLLLVRYSFLFLMKSVSLTAKGNGFKTTRIGSSLKWIELSFCSIMLYSKWVTLSVSFCLFCWYVNGFISSFFFLKRSKNLLLLQASSFSLRRQLTMTNTSPLYRPVRKIFLISMFSQLRAGETF